MNLGISEKTAIVCGASQGIGFACASALAEAQAGVVIIARNAARLAKAAETLRGNYQVDVRYVVADLSTEAGCEKVIREVPNADILVTNCGGAPIANFADLSRDDWREAIELNMLSALDLIQAYLPGMRHRGHGRIVNILNVALQGGYPDLALSSAATAGLAGSVAAIARQAARDGVAINNILPGRFETSRLSANIAHDVAATGQSEAELRSIRLTRQAVQRFGDPGEIGDLCAFLCGKNAGYLIGQNIVIDGGGYPYAG